MKLVGPKVYSNIQLGDDKMECNKQVKCMLLGYAGVGKSLLFNNLCDQQQQVGYAEQVITSSIKQGYCVSLPNSCLQIYDSPGLIKESNRGLLLIQLALHFLQCNLIIIIVKYDARYKINTIPQIKNIYKTFKGCKTSQILVMISYADIIHIDDNKIHGGTVFNKFSEALKQNQLQFNFILFSNLQSDFKTLSELIYYCAVQNQAASIQMSSQSVQRLLGCDGFNQQYKQIFKNCFEELIQKINNSKTCQISKIKSKVKQIVQQVANKQAQDDKLRLTQFFVGYIINQLTNKNSLQKQIVAENNKNVQTSQQTALSSHNQKNMLLQCDVQGQSQKQSNKHIQQLIPKDGIKYTNKNICRIRINYYTQNQAEKTPRVQLNRIRKCIWQNAGFGIS